jgi:Raf kinase inhibitor-like YbhB/YbcL family protein
MSRPVAAALCASLALVVGGCNDDGRALAPAPTVPIAPATTTTTAPAAGEIGGLTITSPALVEGGFLDITFTCDGFEVAPELHIVNVPPTAAELAVSVVDRDAGGYVHWVVTGLAPESTVLDPVPPDAAIGRTDGGVTGWEGPCPPAGDEPHAYVFTVYALPEPIGAAHGAPGRQTVEQLEAAASASDTLVVFYGRQA